MLFRCSRLHLQTLDERRDDEVIRGLDFVRAPPLNNLAADPVDFGWELAENILVH